MKLYTTFDADLISLNAAGISVPAMIRKALEYRVRKKKVHFFVTECPKYELTGRRRKVHTSVTITDRASIDYLNREIKPRQRAAFFKAIVREALVNQAVGVYLKNEDTIKKENIAIKRQELPFPDDEDVIVLKPRKRNRDYAKEILGSSSNIAEKEEDPGNVKPGSRKKNRFGDVSDLSLSAQKKNADTKDPSVKGAHTEPSDEKKKPASSSKPDTDNNFAAGSDVDDIQQMAEHDLMNLFIDM